ncbi:SGNH/GDSL hydrolase family protein [Candidatus Woesearchaeota archaeon]|nr:SGNH/GDSL hydrolase family protein [Candidatus Woesearchaeota archaeon]
MKSKKLGYFLKNLMILVIVIVVMLVFLEIIVRIFFPQNLNYTMFDSTLMYKHIPDFEVRFGRQEFSNLIKFNSNGLRDYEYEYEKPKDTFRVLLLGSSFSQALQVNLDQTYENLVEKKLNENKQNEKRYEVINTAVGGWGTAQELFYLKTEGLKYDPDLITLDFSIRDISENAINSLVTVENGKIVEHIPVKASLPKRFLLFCSRYTHLCSLAQTVILSDAAKDGFLNKLLTRAKVNTETKRTLKREDIFLKENSAEFNEAIEETFLLIKEIKKVADSKNIPLVIFIIPNREQVDDEKLKQFMEKYSLTKENVEYDKFQKLAKKFALENSISYFDALPYFRQQSTNNTFYFNIDGHWNSKGHELAADLIFNYLKNGKKQTG